MSAVHTLISQQMIERLGWMLVHFVWQAAVVAVLLALMLRLLRRSSSNVRYATACAALGLIMVLPLVTAQLVKVTRPVAEAGPPPVSLPLEETPEPVVEVSQSPTPAYTPTHVELLPEPTTPPPTPLKDRFVSRLAPALPYLVFGWLVGVFGLSAWHLGGWAQLQRLKKRMVRPVADAVHTRLTVLADRLGVHRAVGLLESMLVDVPTVVGWIKPVILLPASALTGLNGEQLEAILAHELAHIRRYDYLVNILQTVVEILGFYHPALWWVSHRIRIERENCCDDLAVQICGDSVRYARALTHLEEIRHSRTQLAVAADGGSLISRIARLLGRPTNDDRRFAWLPGLIALLLVSGMIILAVCSVPARASKETPRDVTTNESKPDNTTTAKSTTDVNDANDRVWTTVIVAKVQPERKVPSWMATRLAWPLLKRPSEVEGFTVGQFLQMAADATPRQFSVTVGDLNSSALIAELANQTVPSRPGQREEIRVSGGDPNFSKPGDTLRDLRLGVVADELKDKHAMQLAVDLELGLTTVLPPPPGTAAGEKTPLLSRQASRTHVALEAPDGKWVIQPLSGLAQGLPSDPNGEAIYLLVHSKTRKYPDPDYQGLMTVGYDLGDGMLDPSGKPMDVLDLRLKLLKEIEPQSWIEAGGKGFMVITQNGQIMLICQTPEIQRRIKEFLSAYRPSGSETTTPAPRIDTPSPREPREEHKAQVHIAFTLAKLKTEAVADHPTLMLIGAVLENDNPQAVKEIANIGPKQKTTLGDVFKKYVTSQSLSKQTCKTLVDLLQSRGFLSIEAEPNVVATDNRESEIRNTSYKWFLLSESKGPPKHTEIQKIEYGTVLNVTPHIGPDKHVMVQMAVKQIDLAPAQQSIVPTLRTQEVASTVTIPDGRCMSFLVEPRADQKGQGTNVESLLVICKPKIAAPTDAGKRITATFAGTDLREALAEISKQAGFSITADATIKPKTVRAELDGVPVEESLRQVLQGTPYKFKQQVDAYLVYRPITATFNYEDLTSVLSTLSVLADVPIMVEESVTGKVSATLSDLSLEQALDMILAPTSFAYKRMPGNYYTVASGRMEFLPSKSPVKRWVFLNYQTPAKVIGLLSPNWKDYMTANTDPNNRTITVTGPQPLVDQIVESIKTLDVRPRQVLLTTHVVTIEREELPKLGLEWSSPKIPDGANPTDRSSPYGIQVGYSSDPHFTNSLRAKLNQLAAAHRADLMANPQVMALDGHPTKIQSARDEWFLMTGPSDLQPTREKIETGITMTMTPRIGDNNDIQLELAIEVSHLIPPADGNGAPAVVRRKAKNFVVIPDGGTAAVAGLDPNDQTSKDIAIFVTASVAPEKETTSEATVAVPSFPPTALTAAPAPSDQDASNRIPSSVTKEVHLKYQTSTRMVSLLSSAWEDYVKADTDPNSHVITVTAPQYVTDRIVADIKALDTRRVLLTTRVVAIGRSEWSKLRMEWGSVKAPSSDVTPTDFPGLYKAQIGHSSDRISTDSLLAALNPGLSHERVRRVFLKW